MYTNLRNESFWGFSFDAGIDAQCTKKITISINNLYDWTEFQL